MLRQRMTPARLAVVLAVAVGASGVGRTLQQHVLDLSQPTPAPGTGGTVTVPGVCGMKEHDRRDELPVALKLFVPRRTMALTGERLEFFIDVENEGAALLTLPWLRPSN